MYTRYAIYFTPDGALAKVGAAWLGWDVARGVPAAHPVLPGLTPADITAAPRKYGFHATLKPPMVLAEGKSAEGLQVAIGEFCAKHPVVRLDGLEVTQMGRFLALTPVGDVTALRGLASAIVEEFDTFRAPASNKELARRRAAGLSAAQEQNLVNWGYPYVKDQFRFHMTLSGRLDISDDLVSTVKAHFQPVLPQPFDLSHLTLAGQRASDGMFEEIVRLPLEA